MNVNHEQDSQDLSVKLARMIRERDEAVALLRRAKHWDEYGIDSLDDGTTWEDFEAQQDAFLSRLDKAGA